MPDVTVMKTRLALLCFWYFRTLLTTTHVYLNDSISTKLSQSVCVNLHTPNVTAGYGRVSDLKRSFWEFSYNITCLKRYYFTKLLQIVY